MSVILTRRSLLRTAALAPSALAASAQALPSWEARCKFYLEKAAEARSAPPQALHAEEAKLALGRPIDPAAFGSVLDFIPTRRDLVDFAMSGLIRILYVYGSDPRLPPDLKRRAEEVVLGFRPWLYPEDPPVKTQSCYWTENHQALYSSIEFLAGQLYPDRTFTWLGKPGSWHMEHGRKNLLVWFGLRSRFGFSEWLSPNYYAEDLIALVNLVDFARDGTIAQPARGLTDLVMLDLALHSFDGGDRAASGRSYLPNLKDARTAATGPVISLAFGIDSPVYPLSGAAVSVATTKSYRVPEALVSIARSRPAETTIHEKISPEEALALGFRPEDPADVFTYWTIQAYTHPRIFTGVLAAARRWNIDQFTAESWDAKEKEIQASAGDWSKVSDNAATAMFGANIETYRTPDYQISTAQDYRKGKPAYQQQIWLASLGGTASVWTSHPGADDEQGRPSYWIGNGYMPRAAQHKNLLIALYRIPPSDPRPFTHVYFPSSQFDEIREQRNWLFGRKGDGYLAIAARPNLVPGTRKEYDRIEWVSNARESAWVCRMGRKAVDGPFDRFVERIAKSSLESGPKGVSYREPSGFAATFGWDEDLVVNGRSIPLSGYPRYDTPYIHTTGNEQVYRIRCGAQTHVIDLSNLKVRPFREMT
jgi:hypothetical protein